MGSQNVVRTRVLARQELGKKVLSSETIKEFFAKELRNKILIRQKLRGKVSRKLRQKSLIRQKLRRIRENFVKIVLYRQHFPERN